MYKWIMPIYLFIYLGIILILHILNVENAPYSLILQDMVILKNIRKVAFANRLL